MSKLIELAHHGDLHLVKRIGNQHSADVYYRLEKSHFNIEKIIKGTIAIGAVGAGIIWALSQIGFGAETGLPRPSSPPSSGTPGK